MDALLSDADLKIIMKLRVVLYVNHIKPILNFSLVFTVRQLQNEF